MSEAMQTLKLADTRRVTTRLGYGCSSLMAALKRDAELCRRWPARRLYSLLRLEGVPSVRSIEVIA